MTLQLSYGKVNTNENVNGYVDGNTKSRNIRNQIKKTDNFYKENILRL